MITIQYGHNHGEDLDLAIERMDALDRDHNGRKKNLDAEGMQIRRDKTVLIQIAKLKSELAIRGLNVSGTLRLDLLNE